MPFGGLIVNRVHARAAARGRRRASPRRSPRELGRQARRQGRRARSASRTCSPSATARAIERLRTSTGERDPILVPHLDGDVHDVDGLVALHAHLFGRRDGEAPRRA